MKLALRSFAGHTSRIASHTVGTALIVLASAVLITACGGGAVAVDAPDADNGIQPSRAAVGATNCTSGSNAFTTVAGNCLATDTGPVRQAVKRAPKAAQTAAPAITPDQLFNWAEALLPDYFPDHQTTAVRDGFVFRYYPKANSFVAVTTDGGVYVLFLNASAQVKYVAPIEAFTCLVQPTLGTCAPVLTLVSASPLSVTSPVVLSSNQPLATITSVTIASSLGGTVPGTGVLSADKLSITVTPTSPFPYATSLTVTVKATNEANVEGTVAATVTTEVSAPGAWWPPTSVVTIGVKTSNPKAPPMEGLQTPAVAGAIWQQATKDGSIQYADTGMILTGFSSRPMFLAYFIEPLGKNVCTTLVYKDDGSSVYPNPLTYGGCKTDTFDWIVGTGDGYISHFPTLGKCYKESWNVSSQRSDVTEVICP